MIDPLVLLRAVHFAATVVAVGSIVFQALVLDAGGRTAEAGIGILRRRLKAMTGIALGVALLSGFGWLALLGAAILDQPVAAALRSGDLWTVLTGTRFGLVTMVRAGLALALIGLLVWPGTLPLQLAAAAAFAALPALTGHAGASPGLAGRVHMASDMIHLVSACAWVGALPGLILVLGRGGDAAFIGTVVRRFSLLGIVSVAALTASGVINSWQLLSGPGDLIATPYGQALSVKIALFLIMVAIAAINRFRLTPRLPATAGALRRNSMAEAALGLAVLLVVGFLGTLPPAAHRHPDTAETAYGTAGAHSHSDADHR